MSSSGEVHQRRRWRVVVGERPDHRRRWPTSMRGAGLTQVPGGAIRPGPPGADIRINRLMVVAQSTLWLRHLLEDPIALVKLRRVTFVIEDWRIPQRGWSGRLGPLPHLISHHIRMPGSDEGRVEIELHLRWARPLHWVVAAVLPLLAPTRRVPAPASVDITAQGVVPDWLGAGRNVAAIIGNLPGNDDIRAHDVVLTSTGEPLPFVEPDLPGDADLTEAAPAQGYGTTLAADRAGVGVGARPQTVLIDLEPAVIRGRYGPFGPTANQAELVFDRAGPGAAGDGRGWRLLGPDREVLGTGRLDHPWLVESVRDALSEVGIVRCAELPGRHPLAEAALLVHLLMAGVTVHAPTLPAACGEFLADEVRELITGELPGPQASALEWEVHTVRQRRAAMRQHATAFALPRLIKPVFPHLPELPAVTALLVTKRLEHVPEVLAAIEAQSYPNLEVVLCLHGVELPDGLRAQIAGSRRATQVLTLPPGHGFGEAIGAATARAQGSLVTKFDDDDTYGPEHVWDLVLARHYSGAVLVGKGAEFVQLESLGITVRRESGRRESYAGVVAGGTMLISRGDLEEVGGWRPVPRSIDRGLIDRIRRAGGLVYRTHPLGYVYHRHNGGHTWDPGLEYFLRGGGDQWSGIPAYPEFGTAPQPVGMAGSGGRSGPGGQH